MEIASLLWAVATFSSAVEGSDMQDELCRLADAPILRTGEWHGHSLCKLVNALRSVRDKIDVDLWISLEERWFSELHTLATVLTDYQHLPVDQEKYVERLRAIGCFHAGPHYTRHLLERVNISELPPSFMSEAKIMLQDAEVSAVRDHIMCVLFFALTSPDAKSYSSRVFVSESRPLDTDDQPQALRCPEIAPKAEDFLVSASLAHDRSGHAEFLALRSVMEAVSSCTGKELPGQPSWKHVTGVVRLYVTHHPCLSCIGAMCQLRTALPGVRVEVSYDWLPAAVRGSGRMSPFMR